MNRFCKLALVLALALSAARPAVAAERLAIVNLTIHNGTEPERALLQSALEQAVRKSGAELVTRANAEHVAGTAAASCHEDACRGELGARLLADVLLSGVISKEDGAWVANLSIFDVPLVSTTKRAQAACPHCSAAEFTPQLSKLVAGLIEADRLLPRGTLVVRTWPPGAQVKVDGHAMGTSNLEVVVAAGKHTVELSGPGRAPIGMSVEVEPKGRRPIEVTFPAPPVSKAAPAATASSAAAAPELARTTWWKPQRIAGVTLMAVGVAAAAASIPLFVIDGDCSGEGACLFRRDTTGAKFGLLAGGLAVAVAGAVVTLTTPKARVPVAIAPVLSPGGVGLVGAGQF